MKRICLFIIVILCLLFLSSASCFSEPLPETFVKIVEKLESYALEQGIDLERDENIKDVVTLGYLNAVHNLNRPFGYLDESIKMEMVEWLAILCWFPIVPQEKKKKTEKDLQKIRKALAQNSYERTLASLSLIPGLAVTCVGEVLSPMDMWKYFPHSPKGEEIYSDWKAKGYSSKILIESLKRDKIEYTDLISSERAEKYLK